MKNVEKFEQLMANEAFVEKMVKIEKVSDLMEAFKAEGVEMETDDLLDILQGKELTDEELLAVAGGRTSYDGRGRGFDDGRRRRRTDEDVEAELIAAGIVGAVVVGAMAYDAYQTNQKKKNGRVR